MPRSKIESNQIRSLGILGGGQLARMLVESSHRLGIRTFVLSENKLDPAAQITQNWIKGSPADVEHLVQFFSQVDVITFESEFIDVTKALSAIEKVKKTRPQHQVSFFPDLETMRIIQDRRSQKTLLFENGLPTSPLLIGQTLEDHLSFFETFGPLVYKKRTGGYDGYGTFIFKKKSQLKSWLSNQNPDDYITECYIPFKRELAFSIARNASGKIVQLPLVQTHQTRSRCDWVLGPIKHSQFKPLISKIEKMLKKINYVGVIAFELFDDGKNLLINEIAPRVHNSAHYSQDALTWSQFDLHLFAGLEKKFPPLNTQSSAFAMLNLLGTDPRDLQNAPQIPGRLHWYGKSEARPGRKMGHINFTSNTKINLKKLLDLRSRFLPHHLDKDNPS